MLGNQCLHFSYWWRVHILKSQNHRHCVALNEINFEELSKSRWSLISIRDVASCKNEQKLTVHKGFEFDTHVCARTTIVEAVPLGFRLETVGRIRAAAEKVRILEPKSGVALGTIAFQYLEVHQARQLPGSTL